MTRSSLKKVLAIVAVGAAVFGFFTLIGSDDDPSNGVITADNYDVDGSGLEQLVLGAEKLAEIEPAAGNIENLPSNEEIKEAIFDF